MDTHGAKSHPLLSGKRGTYKYHHRLSPEEMEVMASVCETLFPSVPGEMANTNENTKLCHTDASSIRSFYESSGSQYPLPDEVTVVCQPDSLSIKNRKMKI